uniref:Uncharacterized protein n=1 Tax=Cannabis sativa TaxID=3483 RepID=A0A803Q0I7_CANSA
KGVLQTRLVVVKRNTTIQLVQKVLHKLNQQRKKVVEVHQHVLLCLNYATKKKKDKSVMDEITQQTMVTLQELEEINRDISKEKSMNDTYSEIMGKKRYGSIRIYGFGVCPSDVWENKSSKKRNQSKYIKALESEQKELRSKVQNDNVNNTLTIHDKVRSLISHFLLLLLLLLLLLFNI